MMGNLHAQVTVLLDGTHCPKHGVEWEACCLAEVSIEIHNKVITLLTTVRKEAREAAFKDASYAVRQCSLRSEKYPNRYVTAAAFKTRAECAIEAAANTEEGAGDG